ncbi:TPA: hypothetical protein HA246_07385 [Candidatus Woesearchaeota archaeon]|nr:hypothetical protein [Candidatus Woesearchaeota archaeon]
MLKLAINLHRKEKSIKKEKNIVKATAEKKTNLAYLRGLLDYHEQKYESAITHFSSILDRHHDAAYMGILASLKLNNHENAEFFLEKYLEHIESWQESEEKEFAQKRVNKLKELIDAGKIFNE